MRLARQLIALVNFAHGNDICIGELNYAQFGVDAMGDLKLAGAKKRGSPIGWETPDLRCVILRESCSSDGNFGPAAAHWGCKEEIYQLGTLLLALADGRIPEYIEEPCFSDIPEPYMALIAMCQAEQRASRPDAGTLLMRFDEFIDDGFRRTSLHASSRTLTI